MERPSSARDRYFMKNALNISLRGIGNTWPNPSVGVVVVKNDQIISRGWTQPGGKPHAEVVALKKNNLFLFDSGGQYLDGTTDITRTISIGNPTNEQKNFFTRVLKGNIALTKTTFKKNVKGKKNQTLFYWESKCR